LYVYLDNAATTQPDVRAAIEEHISGNWHNPSSGYAPAERAFASVREAGDTLLRIAGMSGKCVFTSGGTEANNTAVFSCFRAKAHYVTSSIEHPSVYNAFRRLEAMGASVDFVKPRGFCIYARDVAELVREDTALVSIMHVNNETGAINDINSIAAAVKAKSPDTLFHSDGVQALFKTEMKLSPDIDYYTLSAHKIHALKGTGALLAREGRPVKPLLFGGGQQDGLRPGTENTLGIAAFREALIKGEESFGETKKKVRELSDMLMNLISGIDGAALNLPDERVPHILSVSFPGTRAEVLVRLLGQKGIYIGAGAACSRGKESRVLLECGVGKDIAESAVRISMSAMNTKDDIEACAEELCAAVKSLRGRGRK